VNGVEMLAVAPVVTGITFVVTFHMRCIYVVRSLYFKIYYYYYYYYHHTFSLCLFAAGKNSNK
jgi:hypothetical protein